MSKVEAIQYGDRKVYAVAAPSTAAWPSGCSGCPTVWVEGEVTELRRNERWQSVFFTLKDPNDGACLGVTMARSRFDALRLDLTDGERVHVFGRPELFEARGDFRMRALSIERFGLGDHLAALERLKKKLARKASSSGSVRCRSCHAGSGSSPATTPRRRRTSSPRSAPAFRRLASSSPRLSSRGRSPRTR